MLSRSLLLPALAPALLIAGCMGTQNRGLESVHQPVVSRQDYAFDLRTAGDGLAAGEAARLDGWLQAMKLRYGDRVTVDDPAGGRGVRDDIVPVIARYGLVLGADRPVTAAPVAPGTARVVVSRMQASVPGCPDWSRNASQEFDSNTSSNFGCATNASLAAMIANPEDLVHGEAVGITDPARSTKAIEAFRKAAPSGAGGGAK
jgi:pilus assembly protein CpaD